MTIDILRLLAVVAGFGTITAATLLAYRQSALGLYHVIVFCLGAVLAGIPGVQLAKDTNNNWSVSIGQLADAASKTSDAAAQQADAISALNARVDHLQAALEAVDSAFGSQTSHVQLKSMLRSSQEQSQKVTRSLNTSRALSNSAAVTLKPLLITKIPSTAVVGSKDTPRRPGTTVVKPGHK